MVGISVVNIHLSEPASPFILPFSAIPAASKPANPLANAIDKVMSSRVLQPGICTGDKTTAKKRTGMMAGAEMDGGLPVRTDNPGPQGSNQYPDDNACAHGSRWS